MLKLPITKKMERKNFQKIFKSKKKIYALLLHLRMDFILKKLNINYFNPYLFIELTEINKTEIKL